jgi:hypothetical protein
MSTPVKMSRKRVLKAEAILQGVRLITERNMEKSRIRSIRKV